jgi:hypothetical protein
VSRRFWAPLKAGVAGVVIKHGRLRAGSRPDKAAAKAENALKNEKVVPVGFTTHVAASLHQSINERVSGRRSEPTWQADRQ